MKSIQLNTPHALVVIGAPGAGKSTFAANFADTFRAPLINRSYYRDNAKTKQIGEDMFWHTLKQFTKTEKLIIVDGSDNHPSERAEAARSLLQSNYKVVYIWVQTDPIACRDRLMKKMRSESTKKSELKAKVEKAISSYVPLQVKTTPTIVISGRHTFATQARTVLEKLIAKRSTTTVRPAPERNIQPDASTRTEVALRPARRFRIR